MAAAFDAYRDSYGTVVQDSIAFSGLKHDFFVQVKVALLADIFTDHFGANHRPDLVDIGCGIGTMHPALSAILGSLSGTDLSGEALARARRDNPDVDYREQNGDMLPWANSAADVSLAVCVFHHVPYGERDGLLAEMKRVTRPGGLAILIEHNPWNPLTRLAVSRCPFDHDAVLLGAREARDRLARAGFAAAESRHFALLPVQTPITRALERRLETVPLGAQYAAFGQA